MSPLEAPRIIAVPVADDKRLDFLPQHFGRYLILVERTVYAHLGRLCVDYRGGYWQYFNLSNGGCFMAPDSPDSFPLVVVGNGFTGTLDAECAGIVSMLFTLSELSMAHPDIERFAERFYQLRAFALEHPRRETLLEAID